MSEDDDGIRATLYPVARAGEGPSDSGPATGGVTQSLETLEVSALEGASGPVSERLALLAGARHLVERVQLQISTHPFTVRRDGAEVAGVHLRRIAISLDGLGPDQPPAHLDRVEVQGRGPEDAVLESLVASLRDSFGLRPAHTSRFSASLHALGLSTPGPPDLGPTTVDRSMSVGDLAMVVLRRQFAKVLAHEPGTRLGEDPEELHDMRVAIRRMRVAFKLFAPYLPARSLVLRDELKWAGSALGEVRDLDVHLAGVRAWARKLGPDDARALAGLAGPLETQRTSARRRMIRALDSRRFERLVERMTATLVRGPLRSGISHRAAALAIGPEIIEQSYGRVVKSARRLKRSSPPERFHRLRIRFKTLRYALEFHRELYGKPADEAIRALVGLQDLLGEHQDADVATQWLRTLVQNDGRRLPPPTVFAAGMVAERYARRARRLRRRFPATYALLHGKRWRRLVREMERARLPYLPSRLVEPPRSAPVPPAAPAPASSPSSEEGSSRGPGPVVVNLRSRRR